MDSGMSHVERLVLITSKMWSPGDTLTVSFIGGSSSQRQNVIAAATEIMRYANLKFQFLSTGVGMLRVAFNASLGAWSNIGNDALSVPQSQPTINLGFDQPGTYIHELCHGVGAIHEHQSPYSNPIKWNKPQVNHDLGGPPNNWDQATIDHNMYEQYSQTITNGTTFDKDSVMEYFFPASWTLDGFHVDQNAVLSPLDKQWLATKYPGSVVAPPPVVPPTPPTPPSPPITTVLTGFGESIAIRWRNGGVLGDIGDVSGTIKRTA